MLAEPLGQDFHHSSGIAFIAKPNDDVIRIADQACMAPKPASHLLLKPLVQHIVQEHQCLKGRG